MAEPALDVYQGNDWITYRWSVAQMFDTLDQIRELCGLTPGVYAAPGLPSTGKAGALAVPAGNEPESQVEMLSLLLSLCDDLAGELDIVLADLFFLLQPAPVLQWKGFEIRLHQAQLREQCLSEDNAAGVSKNTIDAIIALTLRMRDLLKQIDQ